MTLLRILRPILILALAANAFSQIRPQAQSSTAPDFVAYQALFGNIVSLENGNAHGRGLWPHPRHQRFGHGELLGLRVGLGHVCNVHGVPLLQRHARHISGHRDRERADQ
jgi:hypothetical protein